MKLDILISCMHQADGSLIERSGITGSAVMINQCDREGVEELSTKRGKAKILHTTDRGLTKSRNMAIENSDADLCMLCDDDELFVEDYEKRIIEAYEQNPDADVIIFKRMNHPATLGDEPRNLKFPLTMKVCSVQISFRRQSLIKTGVRFDELLGAGSGNGAEEELKFLTDCQKAGLTIRYLPFEVSDVISEDSTWFEGFDEEYFFRRGLTTRYILGLFLSVLYAFYYCLTKRGMYSHQLSVGKALKATLRGIKNNRISKLKKASVRKEG